MNKGYQTFPQEKKQLQVPLIHLFFDPSEERSLAEAHRANQVFSSSIRVIRLH